MRDHSVFWGRRIRRKKGEANIIKNMGDFVIMMLFYVVLRLWFYCNMNASLFGTRVAKTVISRGSNSTYSQLCLY